MTTFDNGNDKTGTISTTLIGGVTAAGDVKAIAIEETGRLIVGGIELGELTLDVSGLATETTLVSASTKLDALNTISTKLDGLATETTLVSASTKLDGLAKESTLVSTSTKLDTLNTISIKLDSLATQATLASASTKLDTIAVSVNNLGGVVAREITLTSASTKLDTLGTISTKLDGLATQTTLGSISTKLIELDNTIDGLIVNGSLKTSGGITTRNYLDFPTTLFSASGDNTVIASPGAGFRLVISEYKIQNNSTTSTVVLIKKGATVIDRLKCPDEGDGVIQSFDYWKELELPANTAFIVNLSNAVEFFVSGRYRVEAI
jgi:hypothetical protein